jgi:hypothetical protein
MHVVMDPELVVTGTNIRVDVAEMFSLLPAG